MSTTLGYVQRACAPNHILGNTWKSTTVFTYRVETQSHLLRPSFLKSSLFQLQRYCSSLTQSKRLRCGPELSPPAFQTRNMSSDADYASFLDKANQDTGSVEAKGTSKKTYGTKSVDTSVPKILEQVEEYYISDADEPFEPVALAYKGSKVTADDLKNLVGGDKEVEEIKPKGFESQYKKVIDAVKEAGNGEAHVFRVELSETRAEYYVISVDEKKSAIVGLKALSVES